MSIFLSYYDDEKPGSASNFSNKGEVIGKAQKNNSGLKTVATILIVIFLILAVSAFVYLFIFQQVQQSPILKVLSVIPLNKPVPLSTAIISIENLSSVETPSNYNISYNFNASGSVSSSGMTVGIAINGTDQAFSTNNISRYNIALNAPPILSAYFSKANFISLKNGTTLYICAKLSGSSNSFLSSIDNYTCKESNSNVTSELSNKFSSLNANLSLYLKGMNFTMTQLRMSSYNGNSCVQMSGNVTGVPTTLINELLSYVNSVQGSINSSEVKILLNGSINTCISIVNYQPVYLDLKGAGTFSFNLSNNNGNPILPNSGTTSGSYGAKVYLNLTEISSGAPLSTAQILSLPSKPILVTTSNISSILNSNGVGSGLSSGNQTSNLPTSCVALSGFVCSNPIWMGNNITLTIGFGGGITYNITRIAFLNSTNMNLFDSNFTFPLGTSYTGSEAGVKNMVSGESYTVNIPSGVTNPISGQAISGEVWIEFTVPGSSTNQYVGLGSLDVRYQ